MLLAPVKSLRVLGLAAVFAMAGYSWVVATPTTEPPPVANADLEAISRDWTWRRLLHYPAGSSRSDVVSADFFLSPNGGSDPRGELVATLAAFQQPWEANPNLHPRCRFPARYFWLMSRDALPRGEIYDSRCKELDVWLGYRLPESVSVIFVGGYLGNPASMFGHSILKFNQVAGTKGVAFFDRTLGFGANVPRNENPLLYMYRGLFGGYRAGFQDRYFFIQDLTYSKIEARDMWEYELDLALPEKAILVLHSWEIIRRQFGYYFLTDNCGYRVAELIELATGEPIVPSFNPWYIPIETFHDIESADARRNTNFKAPLLQAVRYVPSQQRVLEEHFAALSAEEASAANRIIEDGTDAIQGILSGFSAEFRSAVLDAVIAYYSYRKVATIMDEDLALNRRLDAVVIERLRLPPDPQGEPEWKDIREPTQSRKPNKLAIGHASFHQASADNHYLFRYSPYDYDVLPGQSLGGSKFVLLALELGIEAGGATYLDRATVAEVQSLRAMFTSAPDAFVVPWQLYAGAQRQYGGGNAEFYDGVVRGGVGLSHKVGGELWLYGMVDVALHSIDPPLRLEPNAGLHWTSDDLYFAVRARGSTSGQAMGNLVLEYRLLRELCVRMEVDRDVVDSARLYLSFSF